MIVEQRTYTLHPGKQQEFLSLVEKRGLAIQLPVLGNLVGYFSTDIGDLNQVVHLWGFADLNDREVRRNRLAALRAWQDFVPSVLPLIQQMKTQILKPASFSPIR